MWWRLPVLVSCKRNFLFYSMKFIGDDREEEEELMTWIVSMLKYGFVLFPDCFLHKWCGAQLMQIVAAEKSNLKFILFDTFKLPHAWMNFHRKITMQFRFWLVLQNTTLFGCSFRWPHTFHGSLSWPMKASSNFLHQISSHVLAKDWGVY